MTTKDITTMERSIETKLKDNGVFIISLDVSGESMNVLRLSLIEELQTALEKANDNPDVKAVIFTSGKQDNFIAGADISMIDAADTAEKAAELAKQLQDATLLIEKCKKPSVAAIHGACLGGGLELAMAFDYRVASKDKKTKFGVPEVQLH